MSIERQARKTFEHFLQFRKCWTCGTDLRPGEGTLCHGQHRNPKYWEELRKKRNLMRSMGYNV